MKSCVIIFFILGWSLANRLPAQHPVPQKPRVLVSTDIGGTDPDDNQSMIHLMMYSDRFDLEGLVSSPSFGDGSKEEILRMIDLYAQDYPKLQRQLPGLLSPAALRPLCKQGCRTAAGFKGYGSSTEGSRWIVECARRESDRPLWVLVWGGLDDVAQALHDAPDICSRIRVYWIGGPNKKWSVNSYVYIVENFPDLWIIENNASYRGFISDGKRQDRYNAFYYRDCIAGAGCMADNFIHYYSGLVKMGDTPSLLYMLDGDPSDPGRESWGGSFEPASHSMRTVFHRHATISDTVSAYSVVEFCFAGPVCDAPVGTVCLTLTIDGQSWDGYYAGNGVYTVRYSPKAPATLPYTLSFSVPGMDDGQGTLIVSAVYPDHTVDAWPVGKNWFTDKAAPGLFEGKWQGSRTVSRWREAVLDDWARRWEILKKEE